MPTFTATALSCKNTSASPESRSLPSLSLNPPYTCWSLGHNTQLLSAAFSVLSLLSRLAPRSDTLRPSIRQNEDKTRRRARQHRHDPRPSKRQDALVDQRFTRSGHIENTSTRSASVEKTRRVSRPMIYPISTTQARPSRGRVPAVPSSFASSPSSLSYSAARVNQGAAMLRVRLRPNSMHFTSYACPAAVSSS